MAKFTKNQKLIGGVILAAAGVWFISDQVKKAQSKKKLEAAKMAALAAAKTASTSGTGFDSLPNMTVMQAGQQAAEDWRMKAV